jgi:hypothetical protein
MVEVLDGRHGKCGRRLWQNVAGTELADKVISLTQRTGPTREHRRGASSSRRRGDA